MLQASVGYMSKCILQMGRNLGQNYDRDGEMACGGWSWTPGNPVVGMGADHYKKRRDEENESRPDHKESIYEMLQVCSLGTASSW